MGSTAARRWRAIVPTPQSPAFRDEDFCDEDYRRAYLVTELRCVRLAAIQVLVPPESRTGQLADLSAGVTVEGDRVEISYAVGTRSARSD